MGFHIIAGFASAASIIFLLAKMNIKRVLAFDIWVDISATLLLTVAFFGTFAGMMAAVIGGSVISITLFCLKRIMGYEKPIRKGLKIAWEYVPPR